MNRVEHWVGEDTLGHYVEVKLEVDLYPLNSILKSTYWYTDKCFLFIRWNDREHKVLRIILRSKEEATEEELHDLAGEFLNSVLDQRIRSLVEEETKEVKAIIVKKAFSEALSKGEQAVLKKNVKEVWCELQSRNFE